MNHAARGKMEEAKREAKAEIAINPRISLDWLQESVPYKEQPDIERIAELLARAGTPGASKSAVIRDGSKSAPRTRLLAPFAHAVTAALPADEIAGTVFAPSDLRAY